MTEILELSQFSQHHTVAEMDIGGGGIHSELHPQRTTESELFPQLRLADDLSRALLQQG